MPRTAFMSTGFQVPARLVTNDDLAQLMDTSDEWILQRSGIKTRYWVEKGDTGVALAREASKKALDKAGLAPADIDCIIYCTCTPDHFEPGNGVFLQRELGLTDIPAVDVRNQCSGFIYGLSIADAWIRTGQYKHILLVGAGCIRAGSTRRRAAATRPCCSGTAPARQCSARSTTTAAASCPPTSSLTAATPRSCGWMDPAWRTIRM